MCPYRLIFVYWDLKWYMVQERIDRLKVDTIDGAGGSVAVAKSSQLHEEKGSGAIRLAGDAAGGRRGAGGGGGRGAGGVRAQGAGGGAVRSPLGAVARRLRLCLCDSRRSVHRTCDPNTTRAAPPCREYSIPANQFVSTRLYLKELNISGASVPPAPPAAAEPPLPRRRHARAPNTSRLLN
ncbi:unnamed protein product [Leptidea sinapis]|uniref:Uncharacterized protein n=1 Tax=Leptidea sinapis TaxID=189913 RepID=A0A5E4QUK0_9NEOP|nr:unnamed protein product [Leptidea sinapis]